MARILHFIVFTICIQISLQINTNSLEENPPIPTSEVEDNSRYKTLEANATLMKLLVNNKTGVSRSEVFDMLHSRDDRIDSNDLPTFPQDVEDLKPDIDDLPDSQAEYLQASGAHVSKDELASARIKPTGTRGEPVGLAAAIMVGSTCFVVCAAYAALIIWRRLEIKRNGLKHELLTNEDNIAETRIEL